MQDSLRLVFIFLGFIVIGAVLLHGYWSVRRQRYQQDELANVGPLAADPVDDEGFDRDGVGKVRTVSRTTSGKAVAASRPSATSRSGSSSTSSNSAVKAKAPKAVSVQNSNVQNSDDEIEPSSAVKAEPTLSFADNDSQAEVAKPTETADAPLLAPPPKHLMKSAIKPASAVGKSAISAKAAEKPEEIPAFVKKAPQQEKVEVTTSEREVEPLLQQPEPVVEAAEPTVTEAPVQTQEVFVLNVAAKEGRKLEGAKLLPSLLTLGFKFGEMDIFHRHQDASGSGPVLFSLVNMVKPGTFDLDSMEQFSTPGISLFFTVPSARPASGNFNLMLQAAQKLSHALDGQLLDQHRNPLTDQSIRHTQARIREYERQQLLGDRQR